MHNAKLLQLVLLSASLFTAITASARSVPIAPIISVVPTPPPPTLPPIVTIPIPPPLPPPIQTGPQLHSRSMSGSRATLGPAEAPGGLWP